MDAETIVKHSVMHVSEFLDSFFFFLRLVLFSNMLTIGPNLSRPITPLSSLPVNVPFVFKLGSFGINKVTQFTTIKFNTRLLNVKFVEPRRQGFLEASDVTLGVKCSPRLGAC